MPKDPVSDGDILSWLPPPPPPPPPSDNDESSDEDQSRDWTRRHRRAWKLYHYLASWAAEHPRQAFQILLKLVMITHPDFFVKMILLPLGFGFAGIAAGSLAAWVQSILGNVVRRGFFAYMQSAGMGGYGATYVEYLVRVLLGSPLVRDILKHFHMDWADLEALLTIFLYRWLGCALFSKLVCETHCVDCTSPAATLRTTCSDKMWDWELQGNTMGSGVTQETNWQTEDLLLRLALF
ncbi:hypothetical protein RB595_010255 [Gaeumannomyces hyphopodioides]